ncbi:MAG: site-2 protease family protein [Clostridia bacterium]|nr:site-2 protease family protein [Clostridia bacterium]
MIKITRFFYIHPLVIPLFVLSYFAGGFHTMLLSYAVVSIHELFHLFAALFVHERVGSIVVMPFGMTLRLSASLIRHTGKEIAIALAGPFANVCMLVLSGQIEKNMSDFSLSLDLFNIINVSVLLLNLLPCLPLDGGRILKALLTKIYGYIPAISFMRQFSRIVTLALFLLGIFLLAISRLNISLLMVAGFLAIHLTAEKQQNEYIIMQELLYAKKKLHQKGLMKSRSLTALSSVPAQKIIKKLSYDSYFIIHLTDENESHIATLTESEVVETLLQKGWQVTLGDISAGKYGTKTGK